MAARRTKFYLDKSNKKVAGVCAGIADYTGIDANMVRIGLVVLALTTAVGPILVAYILAAVFVPDRPDGLYSTPEDQKFWQGVRSNPKRSAAEVRSQLRDVDRRLADIETFYTSRDRRLADEIDSLR